MGAGGSEAGGESGGDQASGISSKLWGPTEYQEIEHFTEMFAEQSKSLMACDQFKEEADNIINSLQIL